MLGGIIELEARLSLVKLQQDIAKLEKSLLGGSITKINDKMKENLSDSLSSIKENEVKLDPLTTDIEVETPPTIEADLVDPLLPNIDEIKAKLEDLYNLPSIVISVDDTALTKLNAHIDLKKEHWSELLAYYNENPLAPIINEQNFPVIEKKKDDNNDDNGLASPVILPISPKNGGSSEEQQAVVEDNQTQQFDFNPFTNAPSEEQPVEIADDKTQQFDFNPFTKEFSNFVKEQTASVEQESEGVDIFRAAIDGLKTTLDDAFTSFNTSIRDFITGVEDFRKSQKQGFFKAIFSNIGNFIGQAIAQLIAAKISTVITNKIAQISTGNKITERAVSDILSIGTAFVINTKTIESALLATSVASTGLQAITKKGLAVAESNPSSALNQDFIGILTPIDKSLEEIKNATWNNYRELAQVSLIVDLLKNFHDVLIQGIKRGFISFFSSIVQKLIAIPKIMFTSGASAVGHRAAQFSMIPFQKMFDLIATGQSGADKTEIALRRGYIVASIVQALKQAPAKTFGKAKEMVSSGSSALLNSFIAVIESAKGTRFGGAVFREYEKMVGMIKDSSAYVQAKFARVKESVTAFVIRLFKINPDRQNPFVENLKKFVENVKKVIKDPLILAEKINDKSFEAYKSLLNKAKPVTTEELLSKILEAITSIKTILEGMPIVALQNIVTTNTVGTETSPNNTAPQNEPSTGETPTFTAQPLTAPQLAQMLTRLVERMKGGINRNGVGVSGLRLFSSKFPELGLNTQVKVSEMKESLTNKLTELGAGDQVSQLQDIATFFVKNWSDLAHQHHRSYPPDISFSEQNPAQMGPFDTRTISNNLSPRANDDNYADTVESIEQTLAGLEAYTAVIGHRLQENVSEGSPGPTRNIRMHWSNTVEHIENELKTLVATSAKQGYEVQKNVSEGSPGITVKIREHWKKTFAFLLEIFKRLSSSAIALGQSLSANLIEKSAGVFKNIFNSTQKTDTETSTEATNATTEQSQNPLQTMLKGLPKFDLASTKEGLSTQFESVQESLQTQLKNIQNSVKKQVEGQNLESFDLGNLINKQLALVLNSLSTEMSKIVASIAEFGLFLKTLTIKILTSSKIKSLELLTFTNNLWQSLKQSFRELKINLLTQLTQLNGQIKKIFDFSNINTFFTSITKNTKVGNNIEIESSFSSLWQKIKDKSIAIAQSIETISSDVFTDKIVTAWQTQSEIISQNIKKVSITALFSDITDSITTKIKTIETDIKNFQFKAFLGEIIKTIVDRIKTIETAIKTFQIKPFFGKIITAIGERIEQIKTLFVNSFNEIKKITGGLLTAIEKNLIDFQQSFIGQITRLKDKITIEKEGGAELESFTTNFINQIKNLSDSFVQNIPSMQLFEFSFLTETEATLQGIEQNLKTFNETLYRIFILSDLAPELSKIEVFFKQQTNRIVQLFLKKLEEAKTKIVKHFNSMLLNISNNIGLNLPPDQKLAVKIIRIITQGILSFVTGVVKGLLGGVKKIPKDTISQEEEDARNLEKEQELGTTNNIFQTKIKQLTEDFTANLALLVKQMLLTVGDFLLLEINSILLKASQSLNVELLPDQKLGVKIGKIITKSIISFVVGSLKGLFIGFAKFPRNIINPITRSDRNKEKKTELETSDNIFQTKVTQFTEDFIASFAKILKGIVEMMAEVAIAEISKIIANLTPVLTPVLDTILESIASIADFVTAKIEILRNKFNTAITTVVKFFKSFVLHFTKFFNSLNTLPKDLSKITAKLNPFSKNTEIKEANTTTNIQNTENDKQTAINEPVKQNEQAETSDTQSKALYDTLIKTLQLLNRKGLRTAVEATGKPFSPTQNTAEIIDLIVGEITLQPTVLKDIQQKLSINWDKFTDSGNDNPLNTFGNVIEKINEKWETTGSYFRQVTRGMAKNSQRESKIIKKSLAEGSPGLTRDIRNRWKETSAEVGKDMARMSKQSQNEFQHLSDLLEGIKVTGEELADTFGEKLRNTVKNLARDLTDKASITFYDILGVNLTEDKQIDDFISNFKQKLAGLKEFQAIDMNDIIEGQKTKLTTSDLLDIQESKQKITSVREKRLQVETTLKKPPQFRDKAGELDKRATLQYFKKLEKELAQYAVEVGKLNRHFKVNPIFEKMLATLPASANRKLNQFVKEVESGFTEVESLASDFQTKFIGILNLKPDELKNLGVPKHIIDQVTTLVEKGKTRKKEVALDEFEMPTFDKVIQQSQRALLNIHETREVLNELKTTQKTSTIAKNNLMGETKKTFSQYQKEYKNLLAQNRIAEANELKKSAQLYLQQKATQIKTINEQKGLNKRKLVDTSLKLKQFQDDKEVKAYLDQFKGIDQKIEALNAKLITANEDFAKTIVETNNKITEAISDYQNANKKIATLKAQETTLEQKKSTIVSTFNQKQTNAIDKNDLKAIAKLEKEREQQLAQIKKQQEAITLEINRQKVIATVSKTTVFNESQRNRVVRINALYETETGDEEEKKLSFFGHIKNILSNIKELGKNLFSGVSAQFEEVKGKYPILQKLQNFLVESGLQIGVFVLAGVVGFNLLIKLTQELTQQLVMYVAQFLRGTYNLARELESLKAQFNFVFGQSKGVATLQALRKQSDSLGLSFKDMQSNFMQFTLGLQSARLDPYALELFEGVQKGLAVRGVTGETSGRALVALTQIANKGKVSLEELNGQLGEALPGTLAVASKAMNMTSDELITMVSRGRLLSEEFLPKFLRALSTEADSAIGASLETGNAKLAQLGNTLIELQEILGKGSLEISKPILTGLNALLKTVIDFSALITKILAGVVFGFFYPLISKFVQYIAVEVWVLSDQIMGALAKIRLHSQLMFNQLKAGNDTLTATIMTNLKRIWTAVGGFFRMLKPLLLSIAPMLLFTFAIEAISGVFSYFNNEFDKTAKKIERKTDEIRRKSNVKSKAAPTAEKALAKRGSGNFIGDTIDFFLTSGVDNKKPRMRGGLVNTKNLRVDESGTFSFAKNAYYKEIESASKLFAKSLQLIAETEASIVDKGGINNYIEKRAKIEKELEKNAAIIQAKKSIPTVKAKEATDVLRKRNFALSDELNQLDKNTFSAGSYEDRLKEQRDFIDQLDSLIEKKGDPYGYLTRQKQSAEDVAKTLQRQIDNVKERVNDLKDSFGNLGNELEKVDAKIQAIQFTNEVLGIEKKTTIFREQLANKGINTPALQLKQAELDAGIVQSQLQVLKQAYAERDKAIKVTKDKSSATILLTILQEYDKNIKKIEDASLSTVMLAETTEGLEGEPKELLGLLRKHLESRKEIAQTEQNVVQSYISLADQQRQVFISLQGFVRSIEDLQVSVDDFYRQRTNQLVDLEFQYVTTLRDNKRNVRNLIQQYQDLRNQLDKDIQQYASELKVAITRLKNITSLNVLRGKLNFGAEGIFSGILEIVESFDTSNLTYKEQINSVNQERLQIELDIISQSRQVRDLSEAIADFELQRLQTLKDLVRSQEEFVINQVNSWRGITRQIEDMYIQAENMGFIFGSISQLLWDAQNQLASVVNKLANFNANLDTNLGNNSDNSSSGNSLGGAGDKIIGKIGMTGRDNVGNTRGNHLHITIKNKKGDPVDPFSLDPSAMQILQKIYMGGKPLSQLQPSSTFGPRWGGQHQGVDYGAGNTTPDISTTGTITSIQHKVDNGGYGNFIEMTLAEFPGFTIQLGHLANETKNIVNKLKETSNTASNTNSDIKRTGNYVTIASDLLKRKESFREQAYRDSDGKYRIGYGTEFKGNKSDAYNANSRMTRAEADKQLVEFDIPRFVQVIKRQIGKAWDDLTETTKASLVSIAYNKGSLTQAMVNAIKNQDMVALKQIIQNTDKATHGNRRKEEASLIGGTPRINPQNQPQRLNQKPIQSTGINAKSNYTPIVHETTGEIKDLIKMLSNNQKLTQSQVEEALGFVAIGDTKSAMTVLNKYVSDIASYKKKLADMKAEQAVQEMRQRELNIQKQIQQKMLEFTEGLINTRNTLINNRIQFIKNQAELKGFTSAYDTMNNTVLDAVKTHYDFTQSLESEIRNLNKLTDNTQLSSAELNTYADAQYKAGLMSKETYDKYKALIAQGFSYQDSLRKVTKEYEDLLDKTKKNKDAMITFRKEMALMEANIARLSDFGSIYSGIADIAKVSGNLDLANKLSLKANQLDNYNKMFSIIQSINKQLIEMKTNPKLFDANQIQELESLKQQIEVEVAIKINKEEFDKQAERISSQMNEYKNVFSTIGEIKNKIEFGSGNTEMFLSRILDISAKYVDLDKQLNNLQKSSTDAFSLSLIRNYRSQLGELKTKELKHLQLELSNVGKIVKDPLRSAFSSLLTDFVKGTKSLGEIFSEFLNSMATRLVDTWLDANIDKMLMGLMDAFGGGGDYGNASIDMGLGIAQGVIEDNTVRYGGVNPSISNLLLNQNDIIPTEQIFNTNVQLDTAGLTSVNQEFLTNLETVLNNHVENMNNALSNSKTESNTNLTSVNMGNLMGNVTSGLNVAMGNTLNSILGNVTQQLFSSLSGNLFGGSGILGGLFGFLPKIFGFSEGGLVNSVKVSNFTTGGLLKQIDNFSEGGLVNSTKINNYAKGDNIKPMQVLNYANGGNIQNMLSLAYGVQKAMKKEGSGAVPIVANNRERVLNPNDTLIFNELLNSGKWQQIKEQKIANFSGGGLISNFSNNNNIHTNLNTHTNSTNERSEKKEQRIIVDRGTTINVYAKDATSFKDSQTQIAYKQNLADRRRKFLS